MTPLSESERGVLVGASEVLSTIGPFPTNADLDAAAVAAEELRALTRRLLSESSEGVVVLDGKRWRLSYSGHIGDRVVIELLDHIEASALPVGDRGPMLTEDWDLLRSARGFMQHHAYCDVNKRVQAFQTPNRPGARAGCLDLPCSCGAADVADEIDRLTTQPPAPQPKEEQP